MSFVDLTTLPADALLARSADGDQRAFAEFHRRYATRVLGLARRVVRDAAIAEEVAQDVFHELWVKAADYRRADGDPIGWVLTRTRSRAIDHVRSEEAWRRRLVDAGIAAYERDADVVEDAALAAETRRVVEAALGILSEAQRETLRLKYSDLSFTEVAERQGIPVGTAKTRVRNALAQLRSHAPASLVA
ncbi:sigma-70 family RNA polymerase sigma factor [Pseudolysinimonas sp.]